MSTFTGPVRFVQVETPLSVVSDRTGAMENGVDGVHQGSVVPLALAVVACIVLVILFFRLDVGVGQAPISREYSFESVGTREEYAADGSLNARLDLAVTDSSVSGPLPSIFTKEVRHWEKEILAWSALFGVDPNIVATIMQIESCGNPRAVSVAGAQGLFQVMPFHFTDGEDMLDPDTNARKGIAFYLEQMRFTGGDIFLSFAGYNGGYAASGGSYDDWPSETQRYYYWAHGIYSDAKAGLSESKTLEEWLAAGGAAGCQQAASVLGLM